MSTVFLKVFQALFWQVFPHLELSPELFFGLSVQSGVIVNETYALGKVRSLLCWERSACEALLTRPF
jgi:hypothetical protein